MVVVTTFELGQDSGDAPGEFQAWVERLPLARAIPAPATYHGLYRYNPQLEVLGIVTGEGPEHAASAITALLSDPRFELSHALFHSRRHRRDRSAVRLARLGGVGAAP